MTTVTATVVTMTRVSGIGIRFSVAGRTLCQSMVLSAAIIMTAASATIGICAINSLSPVTSTSSTTAATAVEMRVRPCPIFTLTTVWAIIAQPPMPP